MSGPAGERNVEAASAEQFVNDVFLMCLQAMARDKKLNRMLLTEGKLRKMLAAYEIVGDRGRCGFRVPNKRLW